MRQASHASDAYVSVQVCEFMYSACLRGYTAGNGLCWGFLFQYASKRILFGRRLGLGGTRYDGMEPAGDHLGGECSSEPPLRYLRSHPHRPGIVHRLCQGILIGLAWIYKGPARIRIG